MPGMKGEGEEGRPGWILKRGNGGGNGRPEMGHHATRRGGEFDGYEELIKKTGTFQKKGTKAEGATVILKKLKKRREEGAGDNFLAT